LTRDHNIRAAYIHVMADAAVSVLTIIGLVLAWRFGWVWMDPVAGIVGALVIANWSYGLALQACRVYVPLSQASSNQPRSPWHERIADHSLTRTEPRHKCRRFRSERLLIVIDQADGGYQRGWQPLHSNR
jgi:Co/Zn/Cd efflux system component